MISRIRYEFKLILFFIIYLTLAFIFTKIDQSGLCTPGIGAMLFLLLIPISVIYSVILIFKLYKTENTEYLNSLYILAGVWLIIFTLIKI